MIVNRTKASLLRGETVIGTCLTHFNCRGIGRMLATAGYDFAMIDTQHSAFGVETVCELILQLRDSGLTPMVRVAQDAKALMSRVLDAGAQSIMIPDVEGPEAVRQLAKAVLYPPQGGRSLGGRTACSNFDSVDWREFKAISNEQFLGVVQIESVKALENLDEILLEPGVDVAEIGPLDLSESLGIPGEFKHPKFIRSVELLVEKCAQHGKFPSIFAGDLEMTNLWLDKGIKMLFYLTDVELLMQSSTKALSAIRAR